MSFAEKWKSKKDSYGKRDNKDKRGDMSYQQGASVPSVPIAVESEILKYQDLCQVSGEAIKVFFPILNGDVWLCSDTQARERVKHEGLPCFTFEDLQYIHQGQPGAERRARLQEVYAKRHPTTESILDLFHGKIRSVKLKEA